MIVDRADKPKSPIVQILETLKAMQKQLDAIEERVNQGAIKRAKSK